MRLVLAVLLLTLVACFPVREEGSQPETPNTAETESPGSGWTAFDDYSRLMAMRPDGKVMMPVRGVQVRQVADTFGAPRGGGRLHEGQDIFARKGTPVYSATEGIVTRMGYGQLGGIYVYVMGPGGRRYYYAHLDKYADGLEEGDLVTPQTRLGYVGNTGNARTTPPHLHFGVYGNWWSSDERVINPLPLMQDRQWR
ncbi:MAG: M23 family metallopeptidase [Meiothermus sp.]|nr:M23 family metallopeptidase [Meiothermus sp.]